MPVLIGMTILSIIVGVAGLFFLRLTALEGAGVLRYVVSGDLTPGWAHYSTIFVALVVDIVFIVVGISLWRKLRWPWLLLGAVAMFFAAAVPQKLECAFLVNSLGELLLCASLIATCRRLKV
jgi:hypothetical protein